ncbi:MAG: MerR family transcriptional regulator, partial [Candidatus Schekmanbacteria bacterium]|nr:MerR family transcriptional regulator [Candidatus Schekmanbacteria bacterium]
IKPHVLRYWEAEFGLIKPKKDKQGQRLYRQKDIEIILHIKELLYDQRFSIQGAKQRLKEEMALQTETSSDNGNLKTIVNRHKKEIQELLDILKS